MPKEKPAFDEVRVEDAFGRLNALCNVEKMLTVHELEVFCSTVFVCPLFWNRYRCLPPTAAFSFNRVRRTRNSWDHAPSAKITSCTAAKTKVRAGTAKPYQGNCPCLLRRD